MKTKHLKYIAFSILLVIIIIGIIAVSQHTVLNKESVDKSKLKEIPISTDKLFYLQSGETKVFEHVFWVYSNRWTKEGISWEISNILFKPGIIVSCNPNNGTIYNGDPPVSISLIVTAFDTGNYDGIIKVQRVNDIYDNDIVNITIIVS